MGVCVPLEKNLVTLGYFFIFMSLSGSMHDSHHFTARFTIYLPFILPELFFCVTSYFDVCFKKGIPDYVIICYVSIEYISITFVETMKII